MRTALFLCALLYFALVLGLVAWRFPSSAAPQQPPQGGVDLPEVDPLLRAIQTRLGRPDRLTGSGRAFLHYDLANGTTLTLIVSGDRVVGVVHEETK